MPALIGQIDFQYVFFENRLVEVTDGALSTLVVAQGSKAKSPIDKQK